MVRVVRTGAFSFGVAGPRWTRVTVEDLAGGRTTAAMLVEIVSSAPVVTITRPSEGTMFTDNTSIRFVGRGSDANTGVLGCGALTWTSDQPADVITPATFPDSDGSCTARIRLTVVGPRAVTLTGTDGVNTSSDTVSFTVLSAACTADRPSTDRVLRDA